MKITLAVELPEVLLPVNEFSDTAVSISDLLKNREINSFTIPLSEQFKPNNLFNQLIFVTDKSYLRDKLIVFREKIRIFKPERQ